MRPRPTRPELIAACLLVLAGCTTRGNELEAFAGPDERPGLRGGGLEHVEPALLLAIDGSVPSPGSWSVEGWLNQQVTALPAASTASIFTLHALSSVEVDKPGEGPAGSTRAVVQLGVNSSAILTRNGVGTALIEPQEVALIVALDRSGSMVRQGKLKRVQEGLRALVDELPDGVHFALVLFNRESFLDVAPVKFSRAEHRLNLYDRIDSITAAGGTNISEGLRRAIAVASGLHASITLRHILLVTDGLPTAGESDHAAIAGLIDAKGKGVQVSTLGLGGAFSPSLLRRLALRGGGTHWFIRTASKARGVPVEWMRSLPVPRVLDLKIHIDPQPPWRVEDIAGFTFKRLEDGRVELLGPKPLLAAEAATGDPAKQVQTPPAEVAPMPGRLQTSRPGTVLIQLQRATPWTGPPTATETLAKVGWTLEMADSGQTESGQITADLAEVIVGGGGGWAAHSSAISERSLVLLRVGVSVDVALAAWSKAVESKAAEARAKDVQEQKSAAIDEIVRAMARVDAELEASSTDSADAPLSLSYAKELLAALLKAMEDSDM